MGEFQDLLDDVSAFEIPTKFERFLRREQPPSMSEQTLAFFAYSYEVAFREMAAALKARWRHNGLLQAPLFYVARHSIELHLKWAISRRKRALRAKDSRSRKTPSNTSASASREPSMRRQKCVKT